MFIVYPKKNQACIVWIGYFTNVLLIVRIISVETMKLNYITTREKCQTPIASTTYSLLLIKMSLDNQNVMYRKFCQLAQTAAVLERAVNRQPGYAPETRRAL